MSDAGSVEKITCKTCGKGYSYSRYGPGRLRKYCSSHCRYEGFKKGRKARNDVRHCACCHTMFTQSGLGRPAKFCSKSCKVSFERWLKREISAIRRLGKLAYSKRKVKVCADCASRFFGSRWSRTGRHLRCPVCIKAAQSARDMTAVTQRAREVRVKKGAGLIPWSDAELAYHNKLRRYGGGVKVGQIYKAHMRRGYRLTPVEMVSGKECVECGNAYVSIIWMGAGRYWRTHNVTCGERVCVKAHKKRIKNNPRLKGYRQRARKYGCYYESFNVDLVFERDGWKCQYCGCDTPVQLRGTIEHNAPELDHIWPLSLGGPHTYDNVQCLCRDCNLLKGVKTMYEFHMWSKGEINETAWEKTKVSGCY